MYLLVLNFIAIIFLDGNGANAPQDPWTGTPGSQGAIQSGSYPSGHSPYGTSHLSQPSYPPPPMHGVHDMVSENVIVVTSNNNNYLSEK